MPKKRRWPRAIHIISFVFFFNLPGQAGRVKEACHYLRQPGQDPVVCPALMRSERTGGRRVWEACDRSEDWDTGAGGYGVCCASSDHSCLNWSLRIRQGWPGRADLHRGDQSDMRYEQRSLTGWGFDTWRLILSLMIPETVEILQGYRKSGGCNRAQCKNANVIDQMTGVTKARKSNDTCEKTFGLLLFNLFCLFVCLFVCLFRFVSFRSCGIFF